MRIEKSYKLSPQAQTLHIDQRRRLGTLAEHLEQMDAGTGNAEHRFSMQKFAVDKNGDQMTPAGAAARRECLSAACALGYGAMLFADKDREGMANSDQSGDDDDYSNDQWFRFSARAFGVTVDGQKTGTDCASAWEWMFCGSWKEHDDSARGAAQRIRDYLAGTPIQLSQWPNKRASEQNRLVGVLKREKIKLRARSWSAQTLEETARVKIRQTLTALEAITESEDELRVSGREIVEWARETLSNTPRTRTG